MNISRVSSCRYVQFYFGWTLKITIRRLKLIFHVHEGKFFWFCGQFILFYYIHIYRFDHPGVTGNKSFTRQALFLTIEGNRKPIERNYLKIRFKWTKNACFFYFQYFGHPKSKINLYCMNVEEKPAHGNCNPVTVQ